MHLRSVFKLAKKIAHHHGGWHPAVMRLLAIFRREGIGGVLGRLRFLLGMDVRTMSFSDPGTFNDLPVISCVEAAPSVMAVGHPYLVSGRGEDVRTGTCAFASTDIPFGIRNAFPWGSRDASMYADFPLIDRIDKPRNAQVNIFFLNADEMANAYQHLGKPVFDGKYNIGYWAWELSDFPDAWRDAFSCVHEIWAPSRFTMEAIAKKANCPVIHMPLPVQLAASHNMSRRELELPEKGFLFLFFFDFSSFMNRKNPWAVIKAFERAFKDRNDDVHLVIKLNGGQLRQDDYQHFLAEVAPMQSRIRIVDKVLNDRSMTGLMNNCDCFISLHRAEGFGRGPAEAMYLGKPVIVTGYSGNMDFTNDANACIVDYQLIPVGPGEYPFGEGQRWADADVEHAAWYMRRIYDDATYRTDISRAGKQFIHANLSFSVVGGRYKRRLSRLHQP